MYLISLLDIMQLTRHVGGFTLRLAVTLYQLCVPSLNWRLSVLIDSTSGRRH
jgi:hypothetical protein